MNNKIHEYHDGIAKDLYKQYVLGNNAVHNVIIAIQDNTLVGPEDIEESCRTQILNAVDIYDDKKRELSGEN